MPNPQILAQDFRVAVNAATPAAALALPAILTGAALEFDFIFSNGTLADANLCDLSVYDSIQLKIEGPANPHTGSIFIGASVNAANFQTCTTAQWLAGTAQQLTVAIPSAANILSPGSSAQQGYWLAVYGVLSAAAAAAATPPRAAGDFVPLCVCQLTVVDSGIPAGAPQLAQPVSVGTKISFVCGDGFTRDVCLKLTPNGRWTFDIGAPYNGAGQVTYAFYCSDGLYHDVTLVLSQGAWTLDINQNGHS